MVKAAKGSMPGALDCPGSAIRFYLFYGPDQSGSDALARRLLKGLGAERFVVTAGSLKDDPSLLADEAAALGLFGDKRLLWIEPAGDEIAPGVSRMLDATAVESITVAIAGDLKKSSALVKLAEGHGSAMAQISYLPEARQAERLVIELGRAEGLKIDGQVATRVAAGAGMNQAIIASELTKYSLYLGATPEHPRELDSETIDRLGADSAEGDWQRICDLALDGRMAELAGALQRLSPGGSEVVPIVRLLQRRVGQLAPLRARVEQGERVDGVLTSMGKALFWKDKEIMHRLLSQWSATRLAQISERVGSLERRVMLNSVPGEAALGEELFAIARAARR